MVALQLLGESEARRGRSVNSLCASKQLLAEVIGDEVFRRKGRGDGQGIEVVTELRKADGCVWNKDIVKEGGGLTGSRTKVG
jgi:hypothetical protein